MDSSDIRMARALRDSGGHGLRSRHRGRLNLDGDAAVFDLAAHRAQRPPKESEMLTTRPPATLRPPAPKHLYKLLQTDPEMVAVCVKRFNRLVDVADLVRHDIGILHTGKDGSRTMWRTTPDDLGRTGFTEVWTPGRPVLGKWPLLVLDEPPVPPVDAEPWTAADLLLAARDMRVGIDYAPFNPMLWVRDAANEYQQTIRAARVLIDLTRRHQNIAAAVQFTQDRTGAQAMQIIQTSRLLADGEADKVLNWRGAFPTNDVAVPDLGGDAA